MSVDVEFEAGGRTYRVEDHVYEWDVYALNNKRERENRWGLASMS